MTVFLKSAAKGAIATATVMGIAFSIALAFASWQAKVNADQASDISNLRERTARVEEAVKAVPEMKSDIKEILKAVK